MRQQAESQPSTDPSTQQSPSLARLSWTGVLIASWAIIGVLLLLTRAIGRLGSLALDAWELGLTPLQITVAVAWIIFNAYGEGYRAFQKRFSPRVVVRAIYLARNPTPLYVIFAPAFCMAFFHATRRAKIVAWSMTSMIICFILLLRKVEQPWRGIVDAGVVIALIWGALAIVVFFVRALITNSPPDVSAALPDTDD